MKSALARGIRGVAAKVLPSSTWQDIPKLFVLPKDEDASNDQPAHMIEPGYTWSIDPCPLDMGMSGREKAQESNANLIHINLDQTGHLGMTPRFEGGNTVCHRLQGKVTLNDISAVIGYDSRMLGYSIIERIEIMSSMNMVFNFRQVISLVRRMHQHKSLFGVPNLIPVRIGVEYFWAVVRLHGDRLRMHFSSVCRSRGFDRGIRVHVKNPFDENRLAEILARK